MMNTKNFKKNKKKIPTYRYSQIRETHLNKIVEITPKIDHAKFDPWFTNNIKISDSDCLFLEKLLAEEADYLSFYSEETLKMRFLSPLLRRINFRTHGFQDFYNEKITYKSDHFILRGEVDFVISPGLRKATKPHFFIQEFKQDESYRHPRPQLLAELISAIELNQWKKIKGAYLTASIWNFVILEKPAKNKYQYVISKNFDATRIEPLKKIYKNLLFIKNEIIQITK